MATTTSAPAATSRMGNVALSAIDLEDGFNPREHVDERELARLAESLKRSGMLQPVRLAPAGEGTYRVIAGHRRVLAAIRAAMVEIPAVIAGVDEQTKGLDDALVENLQRSALNPVEEAKGYARLLEAGLTRRGIAERVAVAQKRVTERLELLKLPAGLHGGLADATIPPSAVRPLVILAEIDGGLPAVAVSRVLSPPRQEWDTPTTWADLAADPIAVVAPDYEDQDDLPAGVYEAGSTYPVERFALTEKAQRDLAALCELRSIDPAGFTVRFGRDGIEQATKLGATHPSSKGWTTLIVGQVVAEQLVADQLAGAMKDERRRARDRKRWQAESAQRNAQASEDGQPSEEGGTLAPGESEEDRRRREREEAKQAKAAAERFNDELGLAAVKALAKVKVDEAAVKILSAVDVHGDLEKIAKRGARYGFPGWVAEETTKIGKVKRRYLEGSPAEEKAREFLAGAKTVAELAGRQIALLVMARMADERAVANSARSFYQLAVATSHSAYDPSGRPAGLPWAAEVLSLLDGLAIGRLPEHLTEDLRARRARAEQEQAQRAERQARYEQLLAEVPAMSAEQRAAALEEIETQLGVSPWSSAYRRFQEAIEAAQTAAAAAAQDQPHQDATPATGDVVA